MSYEKELMNEIHELHLAITELSKEVSSLKKFLADVYNRIVWIQQKLGLRRVQKAVTV